jgi:hypothetical protein
MHCTVVAPFNAVHSTNPKGNSGERARICLIIEITNGSTINLAFQMVADDAGFSALKYRSPIPDRHLRPDLPVKRRAIRYP